MCKACGETGLLPMIVRVDQRELAGGNVVNIFCSCDKGYALLEEKCIIEKEEK
jgi:hypothetical protein